MVGHTLFSPEGAATPRSGWPAENAAPAGWTLWVEVEDPTADEVAELGKRWAFHHLALEDCRNQQRRAKYERYATHSFLVALALDQRTAEALDTTAIRIFLQKGLVVSVHEADMPCVESIRKAMARDTRQVGFTPGRIAHALVDSAIDEFMPLLDEFEERGESLEKQATLEPAPHLVDSLIGLRRDLLTLRRITVSVRESTSRLMDSQETTEDDRLYFRDVLDHILAIGDAVTVQLEVCNGALQVHSNMVNERMNQVMKYLAIVSTFLLPMTVISGVFGMNFAIIPTTQAPWGFWLAIGMMVASAVGLLWYFRRRGWL